MTYNVSTPTTPVPKGKVNQNLADRFDDRPTFADLMVLDSLNRVASEYFMDWVAFRSFFGIPDDGNFVHPVFGSTGVCAAQGIVTSQVSLNTACLTGLYYLYGGRMSDIKPGKYDMTAPGATDPKFLPVIWAPVPTTTTLDGNSDGELGPMLQAGHYREVELDWSGMGANGLFAGPYTGQNWKDQAAAIDVPSRNLSRTGKRGIVSELHLQGLRLTGPRPETSPAREDDKRYITGLRIEIESGVLDRVRTLRWPDIGIYLPRRRYNPNGIDDRTCFIRMTRCLTNSSGRIGCCIGHRALTSLPVTTATDYCGPENWDYEYNPQSVTPIPVNGAALVGYEADHVITERCDFLGPIGCQVWASGWVDHVSIFAASASAGPGQVGLRLVGFRGAFVSLASLHGSRVEQGPSEASVSLWGAVDAEWFGAQVAAGGWGAAVTNDGGVNVNASGAQGDTTLTLVGGDAGSAGRLGAGSTIWFKGSTKLYVVTASSPTSISIAPGLAEAIPPSTPKAVRKVTGIETAVVRVERRPEDLAGVRAQGTGIPNDVRFVLHSGAVDVADKRYAIAVQAERTKVATITTTAIGATSFTVSGGSLSAGAVVEIDGIQGPRTVAPNGTSFTTPLNAVLTNKQAWLRAGNLSKAEVNLGAGRGSVSDDDVFDSQPIDTAFASTALAELTMSEGNTVRQTSWGRLAPFSAYRGVRNATDSQPVWRVDYDGTLQWGAGGTTVPDFRLWRDLDGMLRWKAPPLRVNEFDGAIAVPVFVLGATPTLPNLTYERGQPLWRRDAAAGGSPGFVVTTEGTVNATAITGLTASVTTTGAVSFTGTIPSSIVPGRYIKIGGSIPLRVLTVNVSANLGSVDYTGTPITTAAVSWAAPTIRAMASLS